MMHFSRTRASAVLKDWTGVFQQGGHTVKRQSIEYLSVVLPLYNYHYRYRFPQLHFGSKPCACAVSSTRYSCNGNTGTVVLWYNTQKHRALLRLFERHRELCFLECVSGHHEYRQSLGPWKCIYVKTTMCCCHLEVYYHRPMKHK